MTGLYQVGLDLDLIIPSGDVAAFATNLAPFDNLTVGDGLGFSAVFDPSVGLGSYSATYSLYLSDQNVGASLSRYEYPLTLHLQGTVVQGADAVPEPGSFALLILGLGGVIAVQRHKR